MKTLRIVLHCCWVVASLAVLLLTSVGWFGVGVLLYSISNLMQELQVDC